MKNSGGDLRSLLINPPPRILLINCFAIVLAILIAGLEPFNPFPANDVHWTAGQNGVTFGPHSGIVVSSTPLQPSSVAAMRGATLELWFVPHNGQDTNTILTFYTAKNPRQFVVRQWRDVLEIQHGVGSRPQIQTSRADVENLMFDRSPVFLTVVIRGRAAADLYIDAAHVARAHWLVLSGTELSGEVVLGSLPFELEPWSGEIRGLAVYDRQLTSQEISEHFNGWKRHAPSEDWNPVALYKFDEDAGSVAHSTAPSGPGLGIPLHFKLPHQSFLKMPWNRSDVGISMLTDVVINIVGFIPFGFFFCTWFTTVRRSHQPLLITVILGALLSLAIESLQHYLPTRDSDFTDFLTNTFGTFVGAVLYSSVHLTQAKR